MRAELAKKKGRKPSASSEPARPKLTKQQQEMIDTTLEKEAAVRAKMQLLNDDGTTCASQEWYSSC